MALIPHAWAHIIGESCAAPLAEITKLRGQGVRVHPAPDDIFNALHHVHPHDWSHAWPHDNSPKTVRPKTVRVVILGQDPYHGSHNGISEAHGLAFSVRPPCPTPPSLRNIFKEIQRDVYHGAPMPDTSTDLTRWAQQGVLLWNTVLTVEDGKAHSHARLGWQAVTHAVLHAVAQRPVAVLLWGKHAQSFAPLFHDPRHLVLAAAHPSPLSASRGFHGCGHFSAVNNWLDTKISW